jgi:SHS family lactate transporter-like MFS transporter
MMVAILLTIVMRPIGGVLFRLAADRCGWRPMLLFGVVLFIGIEFASASVPSFGTFLVLRAIYGIAMGGEWRLGATLGMNSIPEQSRGTAAGIIQAGYATGYLAAALALFTLYPAIRWRGMFVAAALPAFFVFYIRAQFSPSLIPLEPPSYAPRRVVGAIDVTLWLVVWAIVLWTAVSFFGRGTEEVFPKFFAAGSSAYSRSALATVYNLAAAVVTVAIGVYSCRIGRRRGILIATIVELPIVPMWVYAANPAWLATGALLLQYAVFSLQARVHGAWFRSSLNKL